MSNLEAFTRIKGVKIMWFYIDNFSAIVRCTKLLTFPPLFHYYHQRWKMGKMCSKATNCSCSSYLFNSKAFLIEKEQRVGKLES